MTAWKLLIKLYAHGRPVCNCGHAYREPCGVGYIDGKPVTNMLVCRAGCSAAQHSAKEYVATQILGEHYTS